VDVYAVGRGFLRDMCIESVTKTMNFGAMRVMKNAYPELKGLPALVAHRGASHYAPENTLPSYRLAWKEGAGIIEGDFWLTADNAIVCIHDPTTERTAPGQECIDVREVNYPDLAGHDVGSWKSEEFKDTKIPLLSEILAEMVEDTGIYIEIKQDTPKIISTLLETIDKSPVVLAQVTLIAFSSEIVRMAKQLVPELRVLLLYDPEDEELDEASLLTADELVSLAVEIGADGVDLGMSTELDSTYFRKLREAGLEIHVWTVNKVEDALRYIELGVDSITTDRPQGLREEIAAHFQGMSDKPHA
jgi:glycerophosphoryl diester phosphodiesterase